NDLISRSGTLLLFSYWHRTRTRLGYLYHFPFLRRYWGRRIVRNRTYIYIRDVTGQIARGIGRVISVHRGIRNIGRISVQLFYRPGRRTGVALVARSTSLSMASFRDVS